MSTRYHAARYKGVYPVVPTIFKDDATIDLDGQRRCVDFMIDAGSDGLSLLANFSEQFSLTDEERRILTETILTHVNGRVPVIVTTSHYSTDICIQRNQHASDFGAAMVMVLPPYHGATIRCDEARAHQYFNRLSDASDIPIMVQDAPISGTQLSAAALAGMARTIEQVRYFKIESAGVATKLRALLELGGDAIEGPWDGEESITLLPDLDAGATGAMTGGGYPDGIKAIFDAHISGDREKAVSLYQQWLPLINYENRQTGIQTAKILMKEGGIIGSDHTRHPFPAAIPEIRAGLIETARRLDPLVLRWAR
ncbi:dihydrodipicolinate synthase family protein [Castellaniella sp. MT123]|uniref:dihydrodipicolinate synthase family protein n=1 Tax=Castellaniella sp. MT123 TaxID=3140381 RepID=UPI0031F36586|nr:dihydrodipicolinate synthase family protein [Castellaniella sp.]